MKHMKFHESLGHHQIRPHNGIGLFGVLLDFDKSGGQEKVVTPRRGVLYIFEQGSDLSVIKGIFHDLNEDGSLGPPWTCRRPLFELGRLQV